MVFILRPQHALDNGLVCAPIPDAQGRIPQQHRIPRQARFVRRRAQHGQLQGFAAGVELVGHALPAAHLGIGQSRDDDGAGQEDHGLNGFGQNHGRESAENGVNRRQRGQRENAHPFINAEDAVQHQPAGRERKSDVENNGRQHRESRQPVATLRAVSFFEKIRQGGYFGAHVKRHKEQAQHDQRVSRQPLKIAHEQAGIIARLRQADEMQARNVGGEQRQPDGRPA